MKFAADWFAVAPGEIYPRMFRTGDECPAGLVADAERAGVLADEVKAEPAPRRKGRA